MSVTTPQKTHLPPSDPFADRHLGPGPSDLERMFEVVGVSSLDDLLDRVVPESIRFRSDLDLPEPVDERAVMDDLAALAASNTVTKTFIGAGYHACVTPAAIRRGVFENPGWYTAYTPYQPEIAQGRLEALLNFQTVVADLTGLPFSNASLLDEATAAAEAMTFLHRVQRRGREAARFFVSDRCHEQTLEVVRGRAEPLGLEVVVGSAEDVELDDSYFGALVQYPETDGRIVDLAPFCEKAHRAGVLVAVAADLLALTLLKPPGELGADCAVGSTQRFGVPLGFGGPHAAYFATSETYRRQVPGRLVGVSQDAEGRPAMRLALQTREQHIRRDKATSNICTAQVLLAVIASMYAVYHGPEGLTRIARRVRAYARALRSALRELGHRVADGPLFDTIRVTPVEPTRDAVFASARAAGLDLRELPGGDLGISFGEPHGCDDVRALYAAFGGDAGSLDDARIETLAAEGDSEDSYGTLERTSPFLEHPVFHRYRSETELMRYMKRLESRDLSLTHSMIPLGSCTMKLNAAAEMFPVSYEGFAALHPFAPADRAPGYLEMFRRLERWIAEITGFHGVSLMPNAGAQGEYAGLRVIQAYHRSRGDDARDVCLIPESAHGTNPASAVMAGMKVVVVRCDAHGNIDLGDLRAKSSEHGDRLAALMVTYPSTHGVFEESIREVCDAVHAAGGQVYMDGANLNAMVGVCRPVDIGADVCHLNLHKTFCIPHGGGGPGMGPIAAREHLSPFLPGHPSARVGGENGIEPISAAPWGSASILPISYAYIAMMGASGLRRATAVAILSANYVAKRLQGHYELLYHGREGFVAHECILDTRPFREIGVQVDDIAKRLMDFGFHAPTMSWPVAGTLMIEPTESESLEELDRFCDAMIAIREEIREIETGAVDREDNPLKRAPHTLRAVVSDTWDRPYSRERAAFPAPWTRESKFWPASARIDNAYGDRNLVCSCPSLEAYAD